MCSICFVIRLIAPEVVTSFDDVMLQEHNWILGGEVKVAVTSKQSDVTMSTLPTTELQDELRRSKKSQRSHEGVIGHGLRALSAMQPCLAAVSISAVALVLSH